MTFESTKRTLIALVLIAWCTAAWAQDAAEELEPEYAETPKASMASEGIVGYPIWPMKGGERTAGAALWLWNKGRIQTRTWPLPMYFKGDSWAWVTDSDDPRGTRVAVDVLEAHITAEPCGDNKVDRKANASAAHVRFRKSGTFICSNTTKTWSCAENWGIRWCTDKVVLHP